MNKFDDFYKNKFFKPIFHRLAERLISLGIKPNYITVLAFAAGLVALYFLFERMSLFVIFGLLNMFLDIQDGLVARISKRSTKFGAWLDFLSDHTISLLALVKSFFYLNLDLTFYLLTVSSWLIHNSLYAIFKKRVAIINTRSLLFLIFMFGGRELAFVFLLILNSLGIFVQLLQILGLEEKSAID